MTISVMVPSIQHINTSNEKFDLTVKKKQLTPDHNYWLYFIETHHSTWGDHRFNVFITKQAFPVEQAADHLAQTLAVEEVKSRLEQATSDGMPLLFPFLNEGWCVM